MQLGQPLVDSCMNQPDECLYLTVEGGLLPVVLLVAPNKFLLPAGVYGRDVGTSLTDLLASSMI